MSDTTYNGWTNYETWRVNLEISDDTIQSYVKHRVTFASVDDLRAALEEDAENALTDFGQITEGLALDYARAFVSDVNFHEIAEAAIADNPGLLESDEDDNEEEDI